MTSDLISEVMNLIHRLFERAMWLDAGNKSYERVLRIRQKAIRRWKRRVDAYLMGRCY